MALVKPKGTWTSQGRSTAQAVDQIPSHAIEGRHSKPSTIATLICKRSARPVGFAGLCTSLEDLDGRQLLALNVLEKGTTAG